jgi:hypothetical protein
LQCDRCLVITTFCNLFAPFHGGNTGSNPVGDAKIDNELLGSDLGIRKSLKNLL